MSRHVEFTEAKYAGVTYGPESHVEGNMPPFDDSEPVLTVGDESMAVVFIGSRRELQELVARLAKALVDTPT